VTLWDLESRRLRQQYALHTDTVWALAFSPDGKLLASGSTDRTIRVTDLSVGAESARTLARHESWVYALAFDPSGAILASGSRDDTVLLWDVASGEPLGAALVANTGDVFSLAFSPDGETLGAGGNGPETLVLWDVGLASWQARACRIANRNLTQAEWEQFVGLDVAYRCTCPEFSPGEGAPPDACAAGG
jgi:WD40 repeat protein